MFSNESFEDIRKLMWYQYVYMYTTIWVKTHYVSKKDSIISMKVSIVSIYVSV